MATTRRTRTIKAPAERVWAVLEDPHHMPRWWPGVERVEGVQEGRFTQVFRTKRGRPVRADFHVLASQPPWLCSWEQELPGTPFARVLAESVLEVHLEPAGEGTEVTIAQRQKLRGYSRTGGLLLRRATSAKLDDALDGLARITG
jgi:uncharacterized protein YndB with AHSA1/START domain